MDIQLYQKAVGNTFKAIRHEQGKVGTDIEDKSNKKIRSERLCILEKGETSPLISTIIILLDCLEYPPDQFFCNVQREYERLVELIEN